MVEKKVPTAKPIRRDAATGRLVPKGYGALKGQYVVRDGIDLTKPIAEQVARLNSQGACKEPR
jgi:hypothetical protein